MKSLQYLGFSAQHITALSWLGLAFIVILGAIIIALYLLNALALQKISKAQKNGVCWLGFVPIARAFLMGKLNTQSRWAGVAYVVATLLHTLALIWATVAGLAVVNTVFPLAEIAAQNGATLTAAQLSPVINALVITVAAIILAVIKKVFYLICFNAVLRGQRSDNAALLTALCVPFGFLAPIFLYSAARKEYEQ